MKNASNINVPQNEVKSSLLSAFDLLKSEKDSVKVTGGLQIISRLHETENETNLHYTLKRLIRSLGANVPDMRVGHFAILVNILKKFTQLTVTQLLDLVQKELHASGCSKSEVGDVALGQILVCCAIFRSGLMLKSTDEEQKCVLQLFLTASNKKTYLNTVACLILLDFVNQLNEDQFGTIVWSNVKQQYKKDIKEHTLESLYFLLLVNAKFPQKVKLRKLIGVHEILHEDHIPDICEKLMTGVDFNTISHPIYKEIGIQIAKSPNLLFFWNQIDGYLVRHNRNKELVSINLLNTILLNLDENVTVIPDLLSDNFLKLFMDWFKGLQTASKIRNKIHDEDDNKIMIKTQKEMLLSLTKALKSTSVDNKVRVAILKKLLFHPGEINFTEITGSNIIKSIIAGLNEDGLKKMAKILKKVLLNTSKKIIKENVERNWYNNERVKASELISYIVNHETLKDDINFKISYMQLLMCFGFFKLGGNENVSVSSELAGSIKTCFYRCFTSRFSNVNNLLAVLSSLSTFISTIMLKDKVKEKLEKQFSEENMKCWEMLTELCHELEKNEFKTKIDKVFLILLYQLGLFLFSEPIHVKVARSSIIELKSCYEHYNKGLKKKIINIKDSLKNSEPEWVEVMIEVLLSILSIESSVLRSVVQCVFRLLWEYLTPSCIGQITSVLDPANEMNPLIQDSESEDENEENKSDIHEQEVDQEQKETDEEISDDSADEIDEDDQNEHTKTPDLLRRAVQKALGTAADSNTDTESVDADMISEEEGKKLDEALAEAFKQFHQGKSTKHKKDRKDKKSLADFRIRALDLLDIYLEKDPAMDICLSMIAPLTNCLEFCMQDSQFKELENRLRRTIKNLTKIKKFTSTSEVTIEVLGKYLRSIIDKGDRSHFMYQALGDIITYFAIFVIHCSQKLEIESLESRMQKHPSAVIEIISEAVENYFCNRNCLLPIIFFHNILQIEWDGKYKLLPIITKSVFDDAVRQFRRNEGLNLMIGFYQSLNRYKPTLDKTIAEIMNVEKYFYASFINTFQSENKIVMKSNFLVTLRKLLNVMTMFHENCKIPSDLDFKSLLNIITSYNCINKSKIDAPNIKTNIKSNNKKHKRKMLLTNGDHVETQDLKKKKV